jgi:hypothetical protein
VEILIRINILFLELLQVYNKKLIFFRKKRKSKYKIKFRLGIIWSKNRKKEFIIKTILASDQKIVLLNAKISPICNQKE